MSEQKVTLANLGGGALEELFGEQFQHVLENIMDPNTSEKAREITIKIKIKPNEDRTMCETWFGVDSKLAAGEPCGTHLLVGKEGGKAVCSEYNPQQGNLFGTPEGEVDEHGEIRRVK